MKKHRLRAHDLRHLRDCHGLIGVDEAGRGALAGPVVAGAVLLDAAFLESDWCRRHAAAINDSKRLTPAQREHLYERMDWLRCEHRIVFAAGSAGVDEIETENILGATRLAMRRAIEGALAIGRIHAHPPDPLFTWQAPPALAPGECITDWKVLVDGKPMRGLGFAHKAIVEGDARSLAIAMASIVAKVTRDRLMAALDAEAPGYGFARHKGYATAGHRAALLAAGPSPHHRRIFVDTFLGAGGDDPAQARFAFEADGAPSGAGAAQAAAWGPGPWVPAPRGTEAPAAERSTALSP